MKYTKDDVIKNDKFKDKIKDKINDEIGGNNYSIKFFGDSFVENGKKSAIL